VFGCTRGVIVSYETIRDWSQKLGGLYAKRLRSQAMRPGDHWHLDEVYLSINGKLQYLWHAVDQEGEVLDLLVQPRRNKAAAKKFFRKLLKGLQYIPRSIDRQAWQLCSRKSRGYTIGYASPEEPRRKFSSTNTRTRISNAWLQVCRTRSALSVQLWCDLVVFPSWPTLAVRQKLP